MDPAGKNECSAGKTSALLRGDASQVNRYYVVAHCAPPPKKKEKMRKVNPTNFLQKLSVSEDDPLFQSLGEVSEWAST